MFPGHDPPPRLTSYTLDRAPACTAPRCLCYTLLIIIIIKKKYRSCSCRAPTSAPARGAGAASAGSLASSAAGRWKKCRKSSGFARRKRPKKKTCLHLGAGAGLLLVVENVQKVARVSSHPVVGGLLHAPYLRTHLATVKAAIAWNLTCGGGAVGLTALVGIITLHM